MPLSPAPDRAAHVYYCTGCRHEQEASGRCLICRAPIQLKSDVDLRVAQGLARMGGLL